jgi:DNA-binding CsgD family transcriptional regulator
LRKSQDQLRNLYNRAQTLREEERALIAREIHDELGQELSMLQIDLTYLEDQLPKNKRGVIERIRAMEDLVNTIIRSVQRIATELRPSLLDDLGLAAAIEWQGKEFQKRTGIECKVFLGQEEMAIDRDRSTALFRIFQEALTKALQKVALGKKYISPDVGEQLASELERDTDQAVHQTLSDREYQVMCMIASGKTVKQISEELSLSVSTISTNRARLLKKMNLKNNAEVTYYAIKHGLVE